MGASVGIVEVVLQLEEVLDLEGVQTCWEVDPTCWAVVLSCPQEGVPLVGVRQSLSVRAFRQQSLQPPLVENALFTVKFQITCQFISTVKAFMTNLRSNSGLKEPIWKILPYFSKI